MLEKHSFCKVNLLLNILGKRPDGFHELETVMHPVPLHDELTFQRGGAHLRLACDDPTLPIDGRNLVMRAAALFLAEAGISDGVSIHLRKHIPIAAGLGGGSGNAATTLLALNELFGQPLTGADLTRLATTLGSDVPFFLQDRPALATGRGEVITPLEPCAALRGAHLILAHPGFGISTPWAYGQLAQRPAALRGRPGARRNFCACSKEMNWAPSAANSTTRWKRPPCKSIRSCKSSRNFFAPTARPARSCPGAVPPRSRSFPRRRRLTARTRHFAASLGRRSGRGRFRWVRLEFFVAGARETANLAAPLSDGVTVAQGPLEAFVMVRIHVGQPFFFRG